MGRITCALLIAAVPALGILALAQAPGTQEATSDFEVSVVHLDGTTEEFRDEVARMDLILDQDGMLVQVHMLLATGPDVDTHIWYNARNLVSVKYRYLEITGKAKVAVRTLAPPQPTAPTGSPARSVDPIHPEDYR